MNRKGSKVVMTAAAVAATLLGVEPVSAEGTYELRAYLDWPGGKEIAAGDYDAAITAVSRGKPSFHTERELIAATNLCVAQTMTGALADARAACDKAVTLARRVDGVEVRSLTKATNTAQALSNRGVLRLLEGDVVGAKRDFESAAQLYGAPEAPSRNL